MKSILEFNTPIIPIWDVNISNHPITGQPRKVVVEGGLHIMWDAVSLNTVVYCCDSEGNILTDSGYSGTPKPLVAYNSERGPFINPVNGARIYPDENGMLPDNTLLRYSIILDMMSEENVMNDIVLSFISAADSNGEFN